MEDCKLPIVDLEPILRAERERKPFCPYCGKRLPVDIHLHHICPERAADFQRGVRELARDLKAAKKEPE